MKTHADNSHTRNPATESSAGGIGEWFRRLFGLRNGGDLRGTLEELIEQEETSELPASRDELTLLRNILNLHGLTVYDLSLIHI